MSEGDGSFCPCTCGSVESRHRSGFEARVPIAAVQHGLSTSARCAETAGMMALGFYFAHDGFTPEKYASAIKQLESAGAGSPKGRTLHVALESDGAIQVFDIWESQQDFEAFGGTLMPILAELGVALNDPMVATVHNMIKG